jgi:hypothetical protein
MFEDRSDGFHGRDWNKCPLVDSNVWTRRSGGRGLLREPTAIDIPSGTADGVCVRRAEEDNEICDLLWGDKLEGGLFFEKKIHRGIGRGDVHFRNPIIDLFLD